jgi:hypothetical protein
MRITRYVDRPEMFGLIRKTRTDYEYVLMIDKIDKGILRQDFNPRTDEWNESFAAWLVNKFDIQRHDGIECVRVSIAPSIHQKGVHSRSIFFGHVTEEDREQALAWIEEVNKFYQSLRGET